MRFYSVAQSGQTTFRYVLPNDFPKEMKKGNPNYDRPMKTLYLLHGFSGDDSDWEYNGMAEDLAGLYNLALVMPAGGNNFYLDRAATGRKYQDFVGRELVEYSRKTFGLSDQRKDTLIGGLSMGGYGAMHTALAYPETFAGAICLSPALIIHEITDRKPGFDNGVANYEYYHEVFGDLNGLDRTEAAPEVQYQKNVQAGRENPRLYMAIGTEDFLYQNNQQVRTFFEEQGADFCYEEGPGVHDWKFWNAYIHRGIEWLLK